MRGYVRSLMLAVLAEGLLAMPVAASTSGAYLPPPPSGPGGEDSIETSSGTRCRQSINSNGAYLDLGMVGSAASPLPRDGFPIVIDERDRQATAYARVTIPLGKRPERIDCNAVYRLEIERLRREIELLKINAQ